MTRIVHLTDLHFGLERAELVPPLHEAILACHPDLVVVSGDLTQRARRGQFAQAMGFMRDLRLPVMVIPGNHDVPLYNLFARFLDPFGGFRRGAATDLTPMVQTGRLRLFGMNTADPFSWRRGIARKAEVDRVIRALRAGPPDAVNILVCHHPLEEPPGFERGETQGAAEAMTRLADAGLHLVLSGHLHHWSVGLGIGDGQSRRLFQMQTGTALCARAGERDHGFAVLDLWGSDLQVTPWIFDEAQGHFVAGPTQSFQRQDGYWRSDCSVTDGAPSDQSR
jgi:hypothetical protein